MKLANACLVLLAMSTASRAQTGIEVPGLAAFDRNMQSLMSNWHIPGGSLAISKDGRLVLARGYGLANTETGEPVQPESLFRIASVSKPFTAAGIMKLVEAGKLDLNAKAFTVLRDLLPPKGQLIDARINDMTVRQLLEHSSGWVDGDFDEAIYQQMPVTIAAWFGVPPPASPRQAIRYALGNFALKPDPGTQFNYSNFGYGVLGRIIEEAGGRRYEDFINVNLLAPAGITRMCIGGDRAGEEKPGEVHYYDYPDAPMAPTVYADGEPFVPAPHGGMSQPFMDAFGGWIASAIDLVRFADAFAGRKGSPLLRPETRDQMAQRPSFPSNPTAYQGLGWQIGVGRNGLTFWHDGHHQGTISVLILTPDGFSIAVLFNSAPKQSGDFTSQVFTMLNRSFAAATSWPSHDLYEH